MSQIASVGNASTEQRLASLLRSNRVFGWRRHQALLGKPDFAFFKERVAVFVDGCFWHGCLKCYRRPKSHRSYWDKKMVRNKQRDHEVSQLLRKQDWCVIRIWEHSLKINPKRSITRIKRALEKC